MQSLVISLEKATERRKHISNEFGKQNINYDFFDALTLDLAEPLAKKMGLNIQDQLLSKGELACFMSHVSIWQKMVDENIPYLAIFEDDVYLGENAQEFLISETWIDSHWDIIKIEAFADKVFLSGATSQVGQGRRNIIQLAGKNLGTAGYILSLNGAKKYLQYIREIRLIPLDQVMFDTFIHDRIHQVYQMTPALCIQEMMLFPQQKTVLSSDLLAERKERMSKQKKTGWSKIQLEIERVFKQIKYAFCGRKVEFK